MRTASALRLSEWTLGAFFLYIGVLCVWRNRALSRESVAALFLAASLAVVARAAARHSRWSVVRDWLPAGLLLVAYWSVDWVPPALPNHGLEQLLAGWDRVVLREWELGAWIERLGVLVPAVLELAYLLLYAVPPLAIASFYLRHERERLDSFLFPFLLGTLAAYAMLPHFPVEAPRFAFAGEDIPNVDTVFRRVNVWILDHWDIHASVFPSGHVAAAFSAAFAMRLAAPERRALSNALVVLALLVWLNTVYSRYHYAADGLAGLALSALIIGGLGALEQRRTLDRLSPWHRPQNALPTNGSIRPQ
jgi:membrane-associated phospholipid phosphatase